MVLYFLFVFLSISNPFLFSYSPFYLLCDLDTLTHICVHFGMPLSLHVTLSVLG